MGTKQGLILAFALMSVSGCALLERLVRPAGAPEPTFAFVEPAPAAVSQPAEAVPVVETALSAPAAPAVSEQPARPFLTLSGPVDLPPRLVEPHITVMAPVEVSPGPGAGIYGAFCKDCHGAAAQGYGRNSGDLPIKPADLTTLSLNAGGAFPAQTVIDRVQTAPGEFHRAIQPEFGRTLTGPLVEWVTPDGQRIMTPQGLFDVLVYLESLQV